MVARYVKGIKFVKILQEYREAENIEFVVS